MAWKQYLYCGKCAARHENMTLERCPYCNSLDLSRKDPTGSIGLRQANRKFGRFNYESGSQQSLEDEPRK